MNYKDVVNRIQESVDKHKMLVDFGYGQVSDIKTRAQGSEGEVNDADYPYLFLNPTQHVRTQQQITYNFNMIVMDMAREEEASDYQNFLNIQSDCIQYIDDIVARLYFFYKDKPEVSMDLNYTPFYERFQDDLAGATATLSITVPNSINECIAPFNNDVLINNVQVNIPECPAYDTAFRVGAAVVTPGYPESQQNNEFYARFDEPGVFQSCGQAFTPLAINNRFSTTEPYYNAGDREWSIPVGVTGVFRFDFDLLLTNVQGIDLSQDRLRLRVLKDDDTVTYSDLPELPIDGTVVNYKETFTINATSEVDSVRVLLRYTDEGTPAPAGPLVGYTGTVKIYKVL